MRMIPNYVEKHLSFISYYITIPESLIFMYWQAAGGVPGCSTIIIFLNVQPLFSRVSYFDEI